MVVDQKNSNLSDEAKNVLFNKGTEAPFSGVYVNNTDAGTYNCANCGNPLFSSQNKFHSETPGLAGWPGFNEALPGAVRFLPDDSHGMHRTEVVCANCSAHLGHIFDDELTPVTKKHYCINSVCLNLEKSDNK